MRRKFIQLNNWFYFFTKTSTFLLLLTALTLTPAILGILISFSFLLLLVIPIFIAVAIRIEWIKMNYSIYDEPEVGDILVGYKDGTIIEIEFKITEVSINECGWTICVEKIKGNNAFDVFILDYPKCEKYLKSKTKVRDEKLKKLGI